MPFYQQKVFPHLLSSSIPNSGYLSLWQLTAEIDAVDGSSLTPERVGELRQRFTDWYYQQGNGLYLSHPATNLFLKAREMLKEPSAEIATVKSGFSRLRTQMKQDIGVYTEPQARQPVK